jgi:hypothetical protein
MLKSFKYWHCEEVENTFGLTRFHKGFAPLITWLQSTSVLNSEQIAFADKMSERLMLGVEEWNEEELKVWFITPIIDFINYKVNNFRVFLDRPLSLLVNDKPVSGKVDLFIARGKQIPNEPYFFLHEYKQENKRDNDPLGQLLIAMVAAQRKNNTQKMLYGCYISGRNWFFVVLEGQHYAVSPAHDATNTMVLQDILQRLLFVKSVIETYK